MSWVTTRGARAPTVEQPLEAPGVARERVHAALTAVGRAGVLAELVAEAAVVVDRPALELAEAHVVQVRADDDRHVAPLEQDLDRLLRAGEARPHAEIDRHVGDPVAQGGDLGAALVGQVDRHGGVAVQAARRAL